LYWLISGNWPTSLFATGMPRTHRFDFSIIFSGEALQNSVALLMMLILSTCGALMSSARMAGLMRPDGGVNGATSVYVCCGLATFVSGIFGSSPVFVSLSASAGVHDGGRTGIMSIVVGIYSLLTAFLLSPVVAAIPKCAIAPVLLLVGVSMTGEAAHIEWNNISRALPAFLCAIFQPFTFSVAHGINVGLVTSFVLFFTTGEFISYMPALQKRYGLAAVKAPSEEHVGSATSSQPTSNMEDDPSLQGLGPLPHFEAATSSQPTSNIQNDPSFQGLGPLCIRRPFHQIGSNADKQASAFIEKVSSCIGFDTNAVQHLVEERLEDVRHINYTRYQDQFQLRSDPSLASVMPISSRAPSKSSAAAMKSGKHSTSHTISQ
jgi:hypothetical protein